MIDYKREVLDNGLTVLAHRDKSTAHAAVNIIYKVGAKDEDENKTGFAHLFEHLMFSGSKNVPSFDIPIQMSSGENNAFTNNDYTNYYIVVPKDNLEVALFLEADRMEFLNINPKSLETQKKVVEEEYNERYKNKPYGDLWPTIRSMVYKKHHYRWSTIGADIAHVRDSSLEDVEKFYKKFYNPSNAIISVASPFECDEAIELVKKYFSSIPAGEPIQREQIIEPKQTQKQELTLHRDVPASMIYIIFRMEERVSHQFAVCDIISDLLSGGNSSRMYNALVKERALFSSINAYVTGEVECGMFVVMGQLNEGIDITTATDALLDQVEQMKSCEISDYELEKVKNKFEVNTIFGEINPMNKAMNLCFYEMLGDINIINSEITKFRSLTVDDIHNVSSSLFTEENSSILYYLKK